MISNTKILRSACASLVFALAGAAPLFAQAWPTDSAINALLQPRVASKPGLGIVVALVDKGKPPKILTASASGSSAALDGNTVFEVGSITKVFTTAILADMVRRGEVRLDDPIAKYLPATVRVPARGGRQITLIDLATQSSGLPRLPNNLSPADMMNPYADYTVQKLYDFLANYELPRNIGSQFEYSNLGMGLLGHVLSLRAGKSYEELVTERILEPLGMHDTRITLTPVLRGRLAPGHNAAGAVVANWDFPALAGAGALRSTANDMAKFLAANLDSTLNPVAKDLASAHTPLRDGASPQMKIGLAWVILNQFSNKPLVWHNGGTGGYHSFIGFDPAANHGVVVLSNQTTTIDDIGFHLLDDRFPVGTPETKQHKEISIDPALLDACVGVYQLAPNFNIAVTKEGGSLFTQATGQAKVQIYPESETVFFLKVTEAQIEFVKDASGKVDRIILHQGGANIPGDRIKQ